MEEYSGGFDCPTRKWLAGPRDTGPAGLQRSTHSGVSPGLGTESARAFLETGGLWVRLAPGLRTEDFWGLLVTSAVCAGASEWWRVCTHVCTYARPLSGGRAGVMFRQPWPFWRCIEGDLASASRRELKTRVWTQKRVWKRRSAQEGSLP